MARYRVVRQSFLNGQVYQAGEEVEFDDLPSDNLEPLDAAGVAARENAERVFEAQRHAQLLASNPQAMVMGKALADQLQGKAPSDPTVPQFDVTEKEGGPAAKGSRSKG